MDYVAMKLWAFVALILSSMIAAYAIRQRDVEIDRLNSIALDISRCRPGKTGDIAALSYRKGLFECAITGRSKHGGRELVERWETGRGLDEI